MFCERFYGLYGIFICHIPNVSFKKASLIRSVKTVFILPAISCRTALPLMFRAGQKMEDMAFIFLEMTLVPYKMDTFQGHLGLNALLNKIQANINFITKKFVWPWCFLRSIKVPLKLI